VTESREEFEARNKRAIPLTEDQERTVGRVVAGVRAELAAEAVAS